jgi:hypothetical protein
LIGKRSFAELFKAVYTVEKLFFTMKKNFFGFVSEGKVVKKKVT